MLLVDAGRVMSTNRAARELFSRDSDVQPAGRKLIELFNPSDAGRLERLLTDLEQRHAGQGSTFASLKSASTPQQVRLDAWEVPHDSDAYFAVALRLEDDAAIARQLERANRGLRLLSASNQLLIHSNADTDLLDAVCRLCVHQAGYNLAWIGLVGETGIKLEAFTGCEDIASVRQCVESHDSCRCQAAAQALQTSSVTIISDMSGEQHAAPCRDLARRLGYHKAAILPLIAERELLGLLGLYSSEPDAFDNQEMQLLNELAADLAFGILVGRREVQRRDAEENLRSAKEFLTGVLDNAPLAICVIATDWRVLITNKKWRSDYGLGDQPLTNRRMEEIIDARDLSMDKLHCRQVIELNRPLVFEELRHVPQGERYFICHRFPLRDAAGEISAVGVIALDITERKQAEHASRASEQALSEAERIGGLGSYMLEFSTGRAVWSRNMYRIMDANPANPSVPTVDYFMEHIIHPEDRDTRLAMIAATREDGKPYDVEYRIRRRDGSIRLIRARGEVQRGHDGRPQKMVGTVQDVTEQREYERQLEQLNDKLAAINEELRTTNEDLLGANDRLQRAEQALRDSEERYRSIVEASPDAIVVIRDGRFVYANTAALKLHSAQDLSEIVGRPLMDLVHPEEIERTRIELGKLSKIGQCAPLLEGRAMRLDGSTVDVEVTCVLVQFDGQPAIQAFVRDVSQRKKLELQLRQAQKLESIGTLAGGIAHDFNNILFGIIGYTELSQTEPNLTSETRDNLEEVLNASRRAKDLVQQILTFSRQSEHKLVPVSVSRIAMEALKLLRASLPATTQIRQNFGEGKDIVLADASELHQVVMNLCTNGAQALNDADGTLEISTRIVRVDEQLAELHPNLSSGLHVLLSVADTGSGMSREVLEQIFDPFYTTKEKGSGTGLGLAVVHGIVNSLNGTVTAYSEIGHGSTFHVYLPLMSDGQDSGPAPAAEPPPAGQGQQVLLVDDEVQLVKLSTRTLTRLGYTVTAFSDSRQALEAFRAAPHNFDLALLDHTMPGLTGLQLARLLLKLQPGLPVILTTGFASSVLEEEAIAAGIAEFLIKPLTVNELSAAVHRALSRAGR